MASRADHNYAVAQRILAGDPMTEDEATARRLLDEQREREAQWAEHFRPYREDDDD